MGNGAAERRGSPSVWELVAVSQVSQVLRIIGRSGGGSGGGRAGVGRVTHRCAEHLLHTRLTTIQPPPDNVRDSRGFVLVESLC